MEFAPLRLEHAAALADFLTDFEAAGETRIPAYFAKPGWDHATIVRTFDAWSRGEDVGEFVPSTTTFLMDAGRLLAVSNFRHELTDRLRRHGGHLGYSVRPSDRRRGHAKRLVGHAMEMGRARGLPRLLLTCEPTNIGSARAIEHHGGQLAEEFFHAEEQTTVRLYWLEL